ncbi:bacterioferritin [Methylocaldum szegediense]|uniref:Bacterioferritin n=1 Tax=Methylocaldum szegediense TaxID=73780 RepID=A0ABM9I257_9GAMM|nr:bacterioferritin [Methylocaldum szegediense]CAI8831425.1 bacterioferritin [Methylocaldum szegediense]
MKGNADVIARLNDLLAGELTSIDQYLIHSRMYKDWGFNRLYERIHHELEEERSHADQLIDRILFLEGVPDLSKRNTLQIGQDVPSMLKNDLALEYKVIEELRKAMAFCENVGDFVTRDVLLALLKDTEEDHAHWLEIQLELIEKVGLQNYLQTQM